MSTAQTPPSIGNAIACMRDVFKPILHLLPSTQVARPFAPAGRAAHTANMAPKKGAAAAPVQEVVQLGPAVREGEMVYAVNTLGAVPAQRPQC